MLLQLKRMFLIYYLNLKFIPDPAAEPFWEQKKLVTLLLLTLSALVCKMRKTKLCKELSIQKSRTKDAKSDIGLIACYHGFYLHQLYKILERYSIWIKYSKSFMTSTIILFSCNKKGILKMLRFILITLGSVRHKRLNTNHFSFCYRKYIHSLK